jgi:hypothetical protein
LKHRKTLSHWLTNRFLLIIRNEENFAEKRTFSFTYAKLIVFCSIFLFLVFSLCFYLSTTLLASFFDPTHKQIVLNKKIIALSAKVDSLTTEMEQKAAFTDLVQRVISGKDEELKSESSTPVKTVKVDEINQLSVVDSLFRKEFEKKESNVFSVKNVSFGKLSNLILFNPVSGLVKSKYNSTRLSYEVGLLVRQGEPVKAVANGTVIFAGWTDRNENVIILQHEDNLMTVYKKNSVVLKKDGDAVKAGEVLGVVSDPQVGGNPNFYFELWYKGKPVNPENFITF